MVGSGAKENSAKLAGATPLRPVRKAFEQVYDQLRELILAGGAAQGERLPTEVELARRFGVGRSTVREALRLLVADGLVRTAKGAGGGTFVTAPTVRRVSEYLERNVAMLSLTEDLNLEEFLEVRTLIEVFAVRQVAGSRSDADLAALRETLAPPDLGPEEQYLHNREFHAVLVSACANSLLLIAAQPIFFVLHNRLSRSELSAEFPRRVCADHEKIIAAIEAGDPDRAEAEMRRHLDGLAMVYEGIWRASQT